MFWNLIENLWRPVLEIGILSFAIYWVLRVVWRTRGWTVVAGFLALFALWACTLLLELGVLNTILGSIFSFAPFAVLILFHQEIRRMLSSLGSFSSIYSTREQRETLENVIQAADVLSDARMGALIAIELSIFLENIVDSGVPVDCEVTSEMLETIFFPNNAIHDGGVIIRGGRIARAACIFPLTQRKDLERSLGTRHRAAIGLSEESDAVVVAISEETGMISYAHKGQLIRGIGSNELRSGLSAILISEHRPGQRIFKRIFRPLGGERTPPVRTPRTP